MKTQNLLITTALVALYGCQPQAPAPKTPAPAPTPTAAIPAGTPTPTEQAVKPAEIGVPVKKTEPAQAPTPIEKTAAPTPQEKPVAIVKQKTPHALAAPKSEQAVPVASAPAAAAPVAAEVAATKTEKIDTSKLNKLDKKYGDGAVATTGKQVSVHYTGWLYDEAKPDHRGAKFDSSRDRGQAFEFGLGAGSVIPGWDQGVDGMKVGGLRTLIIPASLGYGARGVGPIPPNATLVFDIELLGVR